MERRRKIWMYSPPKSASPKVPERLKAKLMEKSHQLVEIELKPQNIHPPPKRARFNYLVDIFTKWHQNFFCLCATYRCPGPNALSPFFEARFARLRYVGANCFNLAYMRHTGKWWEIEQGLSVDKCLARIKEGGLFSP